MSDLASSSTLIHSGTWAWAFPGQGSQYVGMGLALYEASRAARAVFDEADDALSFPLSKLCFEGPEEQLLLTKNGQPAILTTSLAALAALRESHVDLPQPVFALGHSLGEYSALVAVGALTLRDAVRLVRLRGEAMQEAVPAGQGKMAAVMGGDEGAVRRLCQDAAGGESLSPANFNAPGQIVIAGTASAVDRACALAKDRSLKAIVLKVSAPFHCELMGPAAEKLRVALAEIVISSPRIPVVTNVTAEPVADASSIAHLLTLQVDHPVLFEQSVRFLKSAGVGHVLEIGPGKVLSGLIRRIDKSLTPQHVGHPDDVARAGEFF